MDPTEYLIATSGDSDNISTHLLRAHIEKRTATKTQKPYYMLVQEWNMVSGKTYKLENFLSEEQKTLLEMTIPLQSANRL